VRLAVTSAAGNLSTQELSRRNRILFALIAALSLAGVIVSAISLQRHFARSATQFCELGQKFNCDLVNRSEYSTMIGIPVAGIGVVGYSILMALSTIRRSQPEAPNWLLAAALAGLAFALRLTYIEAYDLETWCILCLISLALITLITALAAILKLQNGKP
jgi:vitamin-K-epoxide reductase (warfarin-sensitive)